MKSGTRGGMLHGNPLRAGFQHLAPTASLSLLAGRQQLNSPGASRQAPRTATLS